MFCLVVVRSIVVCLLVVVICLGVAFGDVVVRSIAMHFEAVLIFLLSEAFYALYSSCSCGCKRMASAECLCAVCVCA